MKNEEIISTIDADLEYLDKFKQGGFCRVFFVKFNGTQFALKVNLRHEAFCKEKEFNLENEFKVLKKLEGIRGVPKVIKFYPEAPSINSQSLLGKNAMLMEFVPGESLKQSGKQNIQFFYRLEEIINKINDQGYSIPILDFNADNVMVADRNEPVIIDFMMAFKLSSNEKTRKQQIALAKRRLEDIKVRFLD